MKVVFPIKVYQRLRAYVLNTDLEISGLGRVERRGKDFWVTEVRIFEQRVSGAHTTIDSKALGKFYDEIVKEDGKMEEWKLWWHSHNTMEAFFSQTDVDTINDFDTEMGEDNWMLSIVTNHAGKIKARADVYAPIRCTLMDLDWDFSFEDPELDEEIKTEIELMTAEPEPEVKVLKPLFPDDQPYGNGDGMYDDDHPSNDWREHLRKMREKKTAIIKSGTDAQKHQFNSGNRVHFKKGKQKYKIQPPKKVG